METTTHTVTVGIPGVFQYSIFNTQEVHNNTELAFEDVREVSENSIVRMLAIWIGDPDKSKTYETDFVFEQVTQERVGWFKRMDRSVQCLYCLQLVDANDAVFRQTRTRLVDLPMGDCKTIFGIDLHEALLELKL